MYVFNCNKVVLEWTEFVDKKFDQTQTRENLYKLKN